MALFAFICVSAGEAKATPDGPAPPAGYLDRSGLGELVFWQGVNGLLSGSVLAYAVTAGQLDRHCRTTYGPDQEHSQECKDAVGRGAGITVVGLAAGVTLPLLASRGRALKTGDALLVNRGTLIGAMHGYVIPFAAGLEPFDTKRIDYVVEVDESRWLAGLTFAGDVVGTGVGSYLAYRRLLPRQRATPDLVPLARVRLVPVSHLLGRIPLPAQAPARPHGAQAGKRFACATHAGTAEPAPAPGTEPACAEAGRTTSDGAVIMDLVAVDRGSNRRSQRPAGGDIGRGDQ